MNNHMPAGPGQHIAPALPHHPHSRRQPDFYPFQHVGQPQSPVHHPYPGYPHPGPYYSHPPAGPQQYAPQRWHPQYTQMPAYYQPPPPPPPPPPPQQMSHYQSRSPMVVSSQPFAPSITPLRRHTPPVPPPPPAQAAPSPQPIPQPIQQRVTTPVAPSVPMAPIPKQEQMQERIISEQAATPPSQPPTGRESRSVSIAPLERMPIYPKLPWYSVPEEAFPPRSRRRRRRRQVLQEVNTIFPDRNEMVDDDLQGQTPDEAPSEISTIAAPSEPETPATSQAPSEQDDSQMSLDATPTQAGLTSPKAATVQGQHARRDTRTAIAVPNIPALSRPKPSPPAAETQVPKSQEDEKSTPTPDDQQFTVAEGDQPAQQEAVSAPAPPPPAPKSWAELVKRNTLNTASPIAQSSGVVVNGAPLPKSASLADALKQYDVQLDAKLSFLEPRGLVNTGNMCYMNSILQVLIFCVPFYNFLDQVRQRTVHSMKSDTPLVDAMIMFMKEFRVLASAESVDVLRMLLTQQQLEQYGEPVTPEYVYEAIRKLERFNGMRRGHQQDAEEFMGFLLEALHDECVFVMRGIPETNAEDNDIASPTSVTSPTTGDGWFEVGPKQRAAITRTAGQQDAPSPITKMFGGHLRSELRVPGLQPSVTLEPYKPLQLDIGAPHVNNIIDALKGLTRTEALTGDFGGKANSAKKQVFIDSLPPVLILHLKRFQYDLTGTQKIWKKVGYPLELEIPKELFQPSKRGGLAVKGGPPQYRLTSVVYHHGKSAAGGHYTVDVLREDGREWIRIDDTVIRRIRREDVAEGGSEEDPKLLAKALEQHKADQELQKQRNMYQGLDEADKEPEEEKPWSEVNGYVSGHRKWGSVATTGASTPSSATGKKTPTVRKESVGDKKVAYILLYERVRG